MQCNTTNNTKVILGFSALLMMFPFVVKQSNAQSVPDSNAVVFIECSEPGKPTRKGSGVFISDNGHVLTAKHVVLGESNTISDKLVCEGSVEHAHKAKSQLSIKDVSNRYDAAILKFPEAGQKFVQYCKPTTEHVGKDLLATGFPRNSQTGRLSPRKGILSSNEPTFNGKLETDAATTTGLSGGPVVLSENGALVGIVMGASIDKVTGYPSDYGVLAAYLLKNEFENWGLKESKICSTDISNHRTTQQTSKEVVQEIQSGLDRNNCSPGPIDGSYGSKSTQAVNLYNRMLPNECSKLNIQKSDFNILSENNLLSKLHLNSKYIASCKHEPICGTPIPEGYAKDFKTFCLYDNRNHTISRFAEWSGECDNDGYASGNGALVFFYPFELEKKVLHEEYYTGSMCRGEFCGNGRLTYTNGWTKDGNFRNGRLNGFGVSTFADGARHEGNYVNGVREGKGTLINSGGEYSGDWVDGQRNGIGTFKWPDGTIYHGRWVDGSRSGTGTLKFPNGTVHNGEFLEGKPNGKGIVKYTDGKTFKGQWKKGKRHGKFIITGSNGEIKKALYENGEFVKNKN